MTRYKSEWQNHLGKKRPGCERILQNHPVFKIWETDHNPEFGADLDLHNALELLYGDPDCELAPLFLQRVIDMAERCMRKDKLRSEKCARRYPGNEGILLHNYAYARFFKSMPLDTDALLRAAADLVEYYSLLPPSLRDSLFESHILSAARLRLLCGEPALAREALGIKKKFRWHVGEHKLLKALASGKTTPEFRESFEAHFDFIRAPRWVVPISEVYYDDSRGRIDLALIAARYLDADAWPPEPRKILERISA